MRIIKRQILSISLVSSLFLTGCGSEQLLQLERNPNYWEAINFSDEIFEPVPKKQSAYLLKICESTKKTASLPKQYRTLGEYGLYFNLEQVGTYTPPIELQYIATGDTYYLTCRSPKTNRLTAHQIQLKNHPWLKPTSGQERSPITEPVLAVRTYSKAEKRKAEAVDVSQHVQRLSIEFPVTGQLVFSEKDEDGQQQSLFGLPASFFQPKLELSFEKTTDGLPSTTYALMIKSDQYFNQENIVKSIGEPTVDLTYHPLPDVLPANKTIPYVTFRSKDTEKPLNKTISLRYETKVKDIRVRGFNGIGNDNKEIHGFLHSNDAALKEGNFRQLSLLPDKLAKRISNDLKEVTLEKVQGKRTDIRYMTLIQNGKSQSFELYLKERANKTDIYVKDTKTKKAAKLSGEVAANLLTEVEE
ncbi:hypothetical protein [Exiguobacterium undae]